ncbi:hypothetical protein ACHAXM_009526 [Skeletonema potamos]
MAPPPTNSWRPQAQNEDNGQEIPFKRDYERPDVCPVLAAIRIYLRALALKVPPTTPLAVFSLGSSPDSSFRFITARHVVSFLRRSVQAAFNLRPDDKSLDCWTSHSIRVTAANILHRAGMSDSYIQTRLRWKSNTFLMYLRKHTAALDISNRNLPKLSTLVGHSFRPLEEHEQFLSHLKTVAPAA